MVGNMVADCRSFHIRWNVCEAQYRQRRKWLQMAQLSVTRKEKKRKGEERRERCEEVEKCGWISKGDET